MMVIGNVLLQPQRLQRAGGIPDEDAILDDVINLAVCLGEDGLEGGAITRALAESFSGTVTRLAERTGAGVNSAVSRLNVLFQPLTQPIENLIADPPDDAGEVVIVVESMTLGIISALQGLSPPQIRAKMTEIFDILETDLGITPTFIEDLVWGVFDDMVLALKIAPPGETADQRANRRAAGSLISRIRRHMSTLFTFPRLNADDAAQAILSVLDRPDVSAVLTRAACSGEAAADYFRAGKVITDLMPYSGFAPFGEGGLGAAAAPADREEIAWYASKLLEYDNCDGDLGKLSLPSETDLFDGGLTQQWREAFLQASVVLASSAFAYIVEANKEWKVVDRKKYVIHRISSTELFVYRLFEMSESDFLEAIQGDQSKLLDAFRKNGTVLPASVSVGHEDGSNLWTIDSGGLTFNVFKFSGTMTIHPRSRAALLFVASGDLQADLGQPAPSDALRQAFEAQGIPLTPKAKLSVRDPGSQWLLDDDEFEYKVKKEKGKFEVSTGGFWGWLQSTVGKPEGDLVWVNRERTQVLLGQRILHRGTNVSWYDAPVFKKMDGNRYYSLKGDPHTIEDWAYWTSVITDGVNLALGGVKIGQSIAEDKVQYSIASNSFSTLRLASEFVVKGAQKRPISELIGIGFWYNLILDGVEKIIGIIEGTQTPENPPDPATASASDFSKVVEWVLDKISSVEPADEHWSELASEFVLSLLTLLNHDEPANESEERPENFDESGGFVDLFWNVSLLIYAAAVPDSEYALPFQTTSLTAGYWLGGALGVGLVTGFLGLLVGQGAIAKMNVFADGGHFAKTLAKSSGKSLLYFWAYLKLVKGKH